MRVKTSAMSKLEKSSSFLTETQLELEANLFSPQLTNFVNLGDVVAEPQSFEQVVDSLCVDGIELPEEAFTETEKNAAAPLPAVIPLEKVEIAVVNNLDFRAWSEHAKVVWLKDFRGKHSRAVVSDAFWFCICWYFKTGKYQDVEERLFNRIAANYVALFEGVSHARKDFFFRCYADAAAQAVLYSMLLAFPKSRIHFTEKFRKDLATRVSFWTTGVCPERVDLSHWRLTFGGEDVLRPKASTAWRRLAMQEAEGTAGSRPGSSQANLAATITEGVPLRRNSPAARVARSTQRERQSPLVAHFLKARSGALTAVEDRAKLMDFRHQPTTMVERASSRIDSQFSTLGLDAPPRTPNRKRLELRRIKSDSQMLSRADRGDRASPLSALKGF